MKNKFGISFLIEKSGIFLDLSLNNEHPFFELQRDLKNPELNLGPC